MLDILNKLYEQQHLTHDEAYKLFDLVVKGEVEPAALASALTALKIKGEVPSEIAGAASALRDNAAAFPTPEYDFADIVGTGGDGHNTINISTTSAFVAAACGLKVAKHGNRSVSSRSGASDLLAEAGINLEMAPKQARKALDELGVCFLFAPLYHGGFRHAGTVRAAMKTRTLFNILGPLVNPAKANIELMGVFDPNLIGSLAQTMLNLNMKRAAVVHGSGLDEVAIHGPTQVAEIKDNKIIEYRLTPADFGLETYTLEDIKGGTPAENKAITMNILQGKGTPAQMSSVAANTALLMRLFGKEDLKANAQQALDIMATGKPLQLLKSLATY